MEYFDEAELWSRERIEETQLIRLRNTLARARRCAFYRERLDEAGIGPDSVRSPLFEYGETQSVHDFDQEPGPKSDNYPKNCTVEECLIEYVGAVEKQATGIQVSMSFGITMRNCTVCHTSRSGINISEGTFGGAPTSYYDLWRIENGKVAEHWDVMETIAEKDTWQNRNGKF